MTPHFPCLLETLRMHRMQKPWIGPNIRTSYFWLSNPCAPWAGNAPLMPFFSSVFQPIIWLLHPYIYIYGYI